jgi:hypothetical protein
VRLRELVQQDLQHKYSPELGGDLLIGKANRSAIATLAECTTAYALLVALPDGYKPEQVAEALAAKIQTLPDSLRRSLTSDQGRLYDELGRLPPPSGSASTGTRSRHNTRLGGISRTTSLTVGKEKWHVMYEVAAREIPARSVLCLKRSVEGAPGAWAFGKEFVAILRHHRLIGSGHCVR